MSDFFNEEEQNELTDVEKAQMIDSVKAEIFDGKAPEIEEESAVKPEKEESDETKVQEEETEDDALSTEKDDETSEDSSIPEELHKLSKALNLLISNQDGMENRLKQAERRIGGLNNKLSEAKKATKDTDAETPTKTQIDKASKTDEGWEDLQKNFPEWAKAFQNRIKDSTANFVSKEDLDLLRKELSDKKESGLQLEQRLVGIKYPSWKEDIASKEYADWLSDQEAEVISKAHNGTKAEDAIFVLDKYSAYKESLKKPETPNKTKERLKKSVIINKKTNSQKPKSEEEMSEEEYRKKAKTEVFGTN